MGRPKKNPTKPKKRKGSLEEDENDSIQQEENMNSYHSSHSGTVTQQDINNEEGFFGEEDDPDFDAAVARYSKERQNENRQHFTFPHFEESLEKFGHLEQFGLYDNRSHFLGSNVSPNHLQHISPNFPNFGLPLQHNHILSHPNLHSHPPGIITGTSYHPLTSMDDGHNMPHNIDLHKLNKLSVGDSGKPHKLINVATTNLFFKAFGGRYNIIPALSKPSFCPTRNDIFVCGTEEQDNSKKHQNFLIFGSIEENNDISPRITYQLSDHIRDLQWIDPQHVVFAVNQKLGLVRMASSELAIEDVVMFPEFHKDSIREICISEGNKNLVISGGFDGNVFVTDISRLCLDIQKNEKKSENSLYPCKDVVGSVNWHPYDTHLASCTTDTGTLHIFDIRTDKRRAAIVYDTMKRDGLFAHAYKDTDIILLGYGDGGIISFDMRVKRNINNFQDINQKQIGEIRFDYQTKTFAVFGTPG